MSGPNRVDVSKFRYVWTRDFVRGSTAIVNMGDAPDMRCNCSSTDNKIEDEDERTCSRTIIPMYNLDLCKLILGEDKNDDKHIEFVYIFQSFTMLQKLLFIAIKMKCSSLDQIHVASSN